MLPITPEELSLAQNKQWIYSKQNIIQKTYSLLGEASEHYRKLAAASPMNDEFKKVSPKIYKGENLRGLPYVLLDWPRIFNGNDVLAVRTLFWWGTAFSIHLILGGEYKAGYLPAILQKLSEGDYANWFFSFTDDPWHHHFAEDNYRPMHELGKEKTSVYFKLGTQFPLEKWSEADEFFSRSFHALLSLFG